MVDEDLNKTAFTVAVSGIAEALVEDAGDELVGEKGFIVVGRVVVLGVEVVVVVEVVEVDGQGQSLTCTSCPPNGRQGSEFKRSRPFPRSVRQSLVRN